MRQEAGAAEALAETCTVGLVAGILLERGRIREKLLRVADALDRLAARDPESPEMSGVGAGLRAVARDIGK